MKAYSIVELSQECNKEKGLDNNYLFSTREKALAFLHHQYVEMRAKMDATCGEFTSEFSEDGWYECVNKDGDSYEGYISECIEVDAKMTAEIEAEWQEVKGE